MAPLSDVLADLRRALPLLAVVTVAGAAIGGGLALRDRGTLVSTASLLVAARNPDPRLAPSPAELEALLEPPLLAAAAEAAGIPPAALAGTVSIAQRPKAGLYDLAVALRDGEAARKAADVLARGLADRHEQLRKRKLALAAEGLQAALEAARKAREEAERAFLAHVDGGAVERGEAAIQRSPSEAIGAALGKAKAERERLRFALERAVLEERWNLDARSRAALDLDNREPRATVWAEAGEPRPRHRSAKRAAASGAALAFVIAFGGVLAFREFRRPRGAAT